MDNNLTNSHALDAGYHRRTVYHTSHAIHYIFIGIWITLERDSREPPFGLVLFWFAGLSVPLFPEVFENLVNAVDIAHRGFPPNPINYYRPFERIKVAFRLGNELVCRGRGATCDETR